MQRRKYLQKSIGAATGLGLLSMASQSAAASTDVNVVIENPKSPTLKYEIEFVEYGIDTISGELGKGEIDTYDYDQEVRFDEVQATAEDTGQSISYPKLDLRKSGDLGNYSGSVVVDSLSKSNQYSMTFTDNVDGTSQNELGDGHSGASCHGSVNESGQDKWNFDGDVEEIVAFGGGHGVLEFRFNY